MYLTLLLNFTYEPMRFVSERKIFKWLAKDKVEVLSTWPVEIHWGSGKLQFPSVVRLKSHAKYIRKRSKFNRHGVFKRDENICQYCAKKCSSNKLTIDHILPTSRGGAKSSWANCVAACIDCNHNKGDCTPEEAGMQLIRKPFTPQITIVHDYKVLSNRHEDWKLYIQNLE